MVRHAFTMIELIFAIVVIAFIVSGVPQIIKQNDKALLGFDENSTGAFAQEGIFAAAGTAAKVLTYQWDPNSLDPTEPNPYAKELNTSTSTLVTNTAGVVLPLRVGNVAQDRHRRYHSTINTAPSQQELDGLTSGTVNIVDTNGSDAYKCTWSATLSGGYVPDGTYPTTFSATVSNSKMAVIQVNSTGGACPSITNVVTMRIYTANIGEFDYAKRTF